MTLKNTDDTHTCTKLRRTPRLRNRGNSAAAETLGDIALRLGTSPRLLHHINWKKQKMKVRLAVQVFSSSVAKALKLAMKTNPAEFMGCEKTIKFLEMIDRLFDYMNTKNMKAKGYKSPLTAGKLATYKLFFEEVSDTLLSLALKNGKKLVMTERKTAVLGLLNDMKVIYSLGQELLTQKEYSKMGFLMTYKLSQDHLELFFSCLRSRGGFNNNPSAFQVRNAVRQILGSRLGCAVSLSGNAIPQDSTHLICGEAVLGRSFTSTDDHTYCDDYIDLPVLSSYLENVSTYVGGYIIRKLILTKKLTCLECLDSLVEKDVNNREDIMLIMLKNNGGLIIPSRNVSFICQLTESAYRSHKNKLFQKDIFASIERRVFKSLVGTSIFDNLSGHCMEQEAESTNQKLKRNIRSILTKSVLFQGQ